MLSKKLFLCHTRVIVSVDSKRTPNIHNCAETQGRVFRRPQEVLKLFVSYCLPNIYIVHEPTDGAFSQFVCLRKFPD